MTMQHVSAGAPPGEQQTEGLLSDPLAPAQILCRAALNCPHSIADDQITLERNRDKPGNALSQLSDRLASAYAGLTIPAGWVLVPDAQHMTDEQGEAIAAKANCCGGIAYEIYRATIEAAPDAPIEHTGDVAEMAARYRRAIFQVCEGFTLPNDVRKILETALWSTGVVDEQD